MRATLACHTPVQATTAQRQNIFLPCVVFTLHVFKISKMKVKAMSSKLSMRFPLSNSALYMTCLPGSRQNRYVTTDLSRRITLIVRFYWETSDSIVKPPGMIPFTYESSRSSIVVSQYLGNGLLPV